jgi:predicted phage tail protein
MVVTVHPRIATLAAVLVSAVALPAAAQTPGPPQGLAVNLNSDATLTLVWSPPFTGGAPTGYLVQIGTASGATDILNQQIGLVQAFRTAVLSPATYFVRVRAVNSSGVSVASNEVTIDVPCVPPTMAPEGVAWRATASSILVTWEPVPGATGYLVQVGTGSGLSDVAAVNTAGTRTFADVAVPAPGTYFVRVRATQSCGNGPPSTEFTIVAAALSPSTTVVVNELSDFIELKNISTSPINISNWRVQTTTGVDQIVVIAARIRLGTIIQPGCTYLLAPAGTISVPPDEPLALSVNEGAAIVRTDGFIVDAVGRRNSNDLASPNTPYREGVGLTPRRDSVGIASFARAGDTDTDVNVVDFVPLVTANPQNSGACGQPPPPPPPPPPPTSPQPPTNLTATVNANSVALAWTAPPSSSGGPLLLYRLEAGTGPGATNAGLFDLSPSTTIVVFNGVPNGTFYVRVRAVNAAGVSGPSNEVTIVVCAAGCVPPPGAVTNLAAQVSGDQVLLTWTAPSSGPAPDGYVVEAGSGSGLANIGQFPTGSTSPFVLVTDVPSGTYFVRVRASRGGALGPPSNEVVVIVP